MMRLIHFIVLLGFYVAFQVQANTPVKGAACFITDDLGRGLVVEEIITRKLSIPGGYVSNGDPAQSAIRETFEETGLRVEIANELYRDHQRVIYGCRVLSSTPFYEGEDGMAKVPAWGAPHFSREVKAVYLLTMSEFPLDKARFPSQVLAFEFWAMDTPPSDFILLPKNEKYFDSANLLTLSASLNRHLQNGVHALPSYLDATFHFVFSYGYYLGHSALLFLMLPLALASGGSIRLFQALGALAFVIFSANLLKLLFEVPRPYYYFPELELSSATGYSFPSEYAVTATVCWGLLYRWCLRNYSKTLIWFLPIVLVCMSRMYLGMSNLIDVSAGVLLGVGIIKLLELHKMCRALSSPWAWLLLCLLVSVVAYFQLLPTFYYLSSGLFFVFFTAFFVKVPKGIFAPRNFERFRLFVMAFLGLGIAYLGWDLSQMFLSSSLHFVIAHLVIAALTAIWLVLCARSSLKMYRRRQI